MRDTPVVPPSREGHEPNIRDLALPGSAGCENIHPPGRPDHTSTQVISRVSLGTSLHLVGLQLFRHELEMSLNQWSLGWADTVCLPSLGCVMNSPYLGIQVLERKPLRLLGLGLILSALCGGGGTVTSRNPVTELT